MVFAELRLESFSRCSDSSRSFAHNRLGCLGCIPEPLGSYSNLMELPISRFAVCCPNLLVQLLPGSLHHLGKRLGSPLVRPDTSPTTTPNIQERWPLDGRMQLVEEEQVTLALQDISHPVGCSASLVLKLFS